MQPDREERGRSVTGDGMSALPNKDPRESRDRTWAMERNKGLSRNQLPMTHCAGVLDRHNFLLDECYQYLTYTMDKVSEEYSFWAVYDPMAYKSASVRLMNRLLHEYDEETCKAYTAQYNRDPNAKALLAYLTILKKVYENSGVEGVKQERLTLDTICMDLEKAFVECQDVEIKVKLADKIVKWRGLDKGTAADERMAEHDAELDDAMMGLGMELAIVADEPEY